MTEETKILVDISDLDDKETVTLEQGKAFLTRIWEDDKFESEEEQYRLLDSIEFIETWSKLNDRLEGVGYTIFENEEQLREYKNLP